MHTCNWSPINSRICFRTFTEFARTNLISILSKNFTNPIELAFQLFQRLAADRDTHTHYSMELQDSKLSLSTICTTDGRSVAGSSVQLISVSCRDVSSIPPMSPFGHGVGGPLAPSPQAFSSGTLATTASNSNSCPTLSAFVSASETQLCPQRQTSASGSSSDVPGWFSRTAFKQYSRVLRKHWRLVVAYSTPFVLLPWPLALRQPVRKRALRRPSIMY